MKTQKPKKLTAAQKAYRDIQNLGIVGRDHELEFVANVIFCHCQKPTTKLRNLKKLVEQGYEIRTCQFKLFEIRIDGERFAMECLNENIEDIKTRIQIKKSFYLGERFRKA